MCIIYDYAIPINITEISRTFLSIVICAAVDTDGFVTWQARSLEFDPGVSILGLGRLLEPFCHKLRLGTWMCQLLQTLTKG